MVLILPYVIGQCEPECLLLGFYVPSGGFVRLETIPTDVLDDLREAGHTTEGIERVEQFIHDLVGAEDEPVVMTDRTDEDAAEARFRSGPVAEEGKVDSALVEEELTGGRSPRVRNAVYRRGIGEVVIELDFHETVQPVSFPDGEPVEKSVGDPFEFRVEIARAPFQAERFQEIFSCDDIIHGLLR